MTGNSRKQVGSKIELAACCSWQQKTAGLCVVCPGSRRAGNKRELASKGSWQQGAGSKQEKEGGVVG